MKRNSKLHEQTGETKLGKAKLVMAVDQVGVVELTPGWADKLGKALVGQEEPKVFKRSPEARQKMSEAQRKRWAVPRRG